MFCSVKYEHLAGNGFGRNEIRVLGHIARSVDFPGMVDPLNDLDAGLGRDGMAAQLAPLVVIIGAVKSVRRGAIVSFWKLDSGYLQIILGLAGSVGSQQQSVGRIGLAGWPIINPMRGALPRPRRDNETYDSLSGNHWHVRLGQSRACVMTTSYK